MLTNLLIAVGVVVVVAFIFSPAREPFRAPPGYGFRRRVVLGAVCPPAWAGFARNQNADAPYVTVPGDEQMNHFHAARVGD